MERDKASLDLFWLIDESLADFDNLPDPDILVNKITVNIESGLESFKTIMATLSGEKAWRNSMVSLERKQRYLEVI